MTALSITTTRFLANNLRSLFTWICFCLGGEWIFISLILNVGGLVLTEASFGEESENHEYPSPWFMDAHLYLSLPIIFLLHGTVWGLLSASTDPLGLGSLLGLLHLDLAATRASLSWIHWGGIVLNLAIITSPLSLGVGHDLIHRSKSPLSIIWGRWLLAFSCDASFSIEHVLCHHAHAGTELDPATARRGENVYYFMYRSITGQIKSAINIERARLSKKGLSFYSPSNEIFSGWAMSLTLISLAAWVGSTLAVFVFLITSFISKLMLETVNYIQHYGLTRIPKTPIHSRHSWNTWNKSASIVLYNLPRHSDHHLEGSKPYYKLRSLPQVPMLPYGYMTMIILSLVPFYFKKEMQPALDQWDQEYATHDERMTAERHRVFYEGSVQT